MTLLSNYTGSFRNHNQPLERFGRDKGADIPMATDYVNGLRPLLNKFGNEPQLSMNFDETSYTGLAPRWTLSYSQIQAPCRFYDSQKGCYASVDKRTKPQAFTCWVQ